MQPFVRLFFHLLFLALLLCPLAAGLEVTTSTLISGEGQIDHRAEVNTDIGYKGLKYSDFFYTKSLGMFGASEVNYTNDFALFACDTTNSTIDVDTAFEMTEIRQMSHLQNFNLLSSQCYQTDGDSEVIAVFHADNCSASFDLAQNLTGSGEYKIQVKNSTSMHVNEYLDRSDYEGKYEILIGNYIGCNIYPGAEEPCDWLGCP